MRVDALFAARESSYRGEGTLSHTAIYNSVEELLELREAGYLVGPGDRTIRMQKFRPHPSEPGYRVAAPGEATAHHWTPDEIDGVMLAYRQGEQVDRIRRAFPVEAANEDNEASRVRNLTQQFSDPDLFGAWNEGGAP
ncbi:hypothetical protein B5P44_01115 [Mycobacterium sp. CBMA 213]|uniref:Uncharacterized protein n=1 Tax=Mycolicibacterium sp. CBMA 213 TaxID=1968788 RepID=A0A343VRL6_9MYCO|nr:MULTISPECIES: hypothetical protein [unclassified Mycolicibacterium]AVN58540.1 hypothetical protein B5P44_p00245 [Mycolicibacterium sp. CBMA 213]MUL61184.1 hypothetical protein [Mycolicibacterium sp. CBMA 335]MUM03421.1 hypothetical protein [Mycolicibacterium sp. CBMA 213]